MVPSFLAPIFTSIVAPEVGPDARNTSSRVICHLHRAAALLRHRERQRLQVDQRLAAKPAADFRRCGADVGDVDAQQLGAVRADHEVALAGAVDWSLAVSADQQIQACGSI